ncbi:MAG: hypothetical protein Tsb0032_27860 [Kiloniellaceae bacterium]
MEAKLIDAPLDPCFPPRPSSLDAGRPPLATCIDRYLRAAGLTDAARRAALTDSCLTDLTAKQRGGETSWAEIIAAIDRCLVRQLVPEAAQRVPPSVSGRVALRLGDGTAGGGLCDGSTPPRQHFAMHPQDLSLWRPRDVAAGGLLKRLQIGRPAQGIAACLLWLAVVVIP